MHERLPGEILPLREQVYEELGEHGPRLIEAMVAIEELQRVEQSEIAAIHAEYSRIRSLYKERYEEYDQSRVDELYRRFEEAGVAYCSGCEDMRGESDIETTLAIGDRYWMVLDCMSRKSGISPAQELHQLCSDCRENPDAKDKHLPTSDSEKEIKLFSADVSDEETITYTDEDGELVAISPKQVKRFSFADEHEVQFRIFHNLPAKIEPWAEGIPPSIHKLQEMHYDHTYNPGGRPLAYVGRINTPAANAMLQELRNQRLGDS